MSTQLVVSLPSHGEVGYDTDLNIALTAIVAQINTILDVLATGGGGGGGGGGTTPTGDITVVPNLDGSFQVTPTGTNVAIVDNQDGTFNLTITQPAQLVVVDNGNGTFGVTP